VNMTRYGGPLSHNSEFGVEYVGTDRYDMLSYLYVRL
jgi:hypothetical protein